MLGVTTDLALVDPSFIRLCGQRFHARLGIEENAKRKFRNYYGKDWADLATTLNAGTFIYLLRDQLDLIAVPLFKPKRTPTRYISHKQNVIKRFIDFTREA